MDINPAIVYRQMDNTVAKPPSIINIPNIVTFIRIALTPLIMVFLLLQSPHKSLELNRIYAYLSAFFFLLAALSDLIDGYYARRYGQVSLMGKFFDPMADKVILLAAVVLLIPLYRMPDWVAVVILFREIVISGMRTVAAGEGLIISASSLAKKKTAFYNVGLVAILLYYPFLGINFYGAGWWIMAIGILLSYVSGIEYMKLFFKEMRRIGKV